MVYTGYVSNGLQNAEETGKLTADLFFLRFIIRYANRIYLEWVPYGDPNDWSHGLAVYDGLELMSGNEEELQPSLNRVMKNIDYDLAMKHPLEHTWTLWHLENDRTKRWAEMLVDVTSFNTVEDFFRSGTDSYIYIYILYIYILFYFDSVYYFVKPPSDLKIFNDYMVFKKNIR